MGYLLLHLEPVYRRAQSEGYVVPPIPMHIPPLLHWLLTVTWEPVYARAQSEEHVVPPIPMHMPPLLHGLLTVTLGTSIS
jgi:hypothetical protein